MGVLGKLGKFALNQVPALGTILDGVELIGDLIGGDTGKKIKSGVDLVADGLNEVGKTPLTPEQQVELEKIKSDKEVELKELAYKDKKLTYDDQAGGRQVIMNALNSDDKLVRQARPKMMLLLGKFAIIYTVITPILILDMAWLGIEKAIIDLTITLILWQGGTLWSAFITSFTGYTVARSSDKAQMRKLETGEDPSQLLSKLSGIGNFLAGVKK